MSSASQPPSGWYPDPAGSGGERYWDGLGWTQATRSSQPAPPEAESPRPGEGDVGFYSYDGNTEFGVDPGQGFAPAQPTMRIAAWGWRLLAWLIDFAVLYLPLAFLRQWLLADGVAVYEEWLWDMAGGVLAPIPDELWSLAWSQTLLTAGVWLAYRIVMIGALGATVGKMLLGMRVIEAGDQSLAKPSWGRAALRGVTAVLFFTVPIVNVVNVFFPLANQRVQALHDLASKTLVLKKN